MDVVMRWDNERSRLAVERQHTTDEQRCSPALHKG